jgi:hypothetical protein
MVQTKASIRRSPRSDLDGAPAVSFNSDTGFVVVKLPNGGNRTIESLMQQVDAHRCTLGVTPTRLAREAMVSDGVVVRALNGHRPAERSRLTGDASGPGRVHLRTFLAILHAMGLDLEIVSRS